MNTHKQVHIRYVKGCEDCRLRFAEARQARVGRPCPKPGCDNPRLISGYCSECRRAITEARRAKDHLSWRRNHLKKSYGLTHEQYEAILEQQGGVCAICGGLQSRRDRVFLDTDHSHDTGEVRGLLCNACNLGLGKFADDPERLRAAAVYLENSRSEFVS